ERGAAREAVQAPLQIDDRPVESCIDSPTRDSNPGDPSRFESHSGSQLLMNFRRTLLGVVSLLLACKSTDAGAGTGELGERPRPLHVLWVAGGGFHDYDGPVPLPTGKLRLLLPPATDVKLDLGGRGGQKVPGPDQP